MKKILLFSLLICAKTAFAQYKKGDFLLNVGLGTSSYSGQAVPGVSFEYGFGKFISAGLQSDLYTYRYGPERAVYTSLPTALRASYHFGKHFLKIKTLDLYGGASVGTWSPRHYDYRPGRPKIYVGDNDGLYLGLYAGARYYFQPKFAVFSEIGHKISWLKAGVTFRFY